MGFLLYRVRNLKKISKTSKVSDLVWMIWFLLPTVEKNLSLNSCKTTGVSWKLNAVYWRVLGKIAVYTVVFWESSGVYRPFMTKKRKRRFFCYYFFISLSCQKVNSMVHLFFWTVCIINNFLHKLLKKEVELRKGGSSTFFQNSLSKELFDSRSKT